jgi:HK97 family phage portal protein
MFNRVRGWFQPQKTAPEPRGLRVAFTRGDELLTDFGTTRSGASLNDAILRALGGQASLDATTLSRAVAVSATAFACMERRANTISQVPLYATLPTGDRLDDADSPFAFFLRQSPLILERASRSADIWGRVFLRKRRNASGWPTGLEWVNPVNVVEVGQPQIAYYMIFNEQTWTQERVEVEDLIEANTFDSRPNGTGISRLEAAYRLIGLDFGTVTHALAFMTNSARIDGMITFDQEVSVEKMASAREDWRRNFKGAGNAHKTAVMPNGARWVPIQATPKDLMMGETKKDVRAEVAVIFDVDLGLLGLEGVADALSANSTYSAKEVGLIRNAALPFVRTVFLPALNEQWASRDFRAAYEIQADETKIQALAESNLVKADTANAVRTSGLYTHDEARALVGMEPEADYLKRAPDEPLKLWQAGTATLNYFHRLTLGRAPLVDAGLAENGEVVLLNGAVIPVNRIAELANANVDRMKNPIPFSPFGAPTPTTPQDVTVTTPETPALADGQRDTGDNLFVGLDLSNNVDLVGLQRQLRERYPNVTWNDPADFHVTLFYAPVCDPAKARAFSDALRFVDVPEMTLRIGSLKSFDSIGEHAIHFRVRENADLRDFQETVYALATECGIEASSYSLPSMWIPHITMGYAPEKQTVYWSSKIAVAPKGLLCNHGDKPLLEAAPLLAASNDTTRAASSLDLAISFADHAFVKAARRELSAYLAERGYTNPRWTPESQWRLDLLSFDQWSANLVSRFIREADYANTRPLDLETTGFAEANGRIYLAVVPNDGLDSLVTALALDMEAAGMTPIQPALMGIALCELASGETVDLAGVPVANYPLVGANITAYKNGVEAAYRWALRSLSKAQETDLDRWEKVVRRKGKDAPFTTRHIPAIVAEFIRFGLEDAEADADVVFADAVALLRTYRDTRSNYQDEIRAAIERARADSVSQRKFDGEMRSITRRFGLQTVYDAYDDAGSPIESLSQDDLTLFRAWQQETNGYIKGFATELFKEGGIGDAMVDVRVALWANKSLDDLYYTMLRQAAPQLEVTWQRNPEAESCDDCLSRDGQTATLDEWGQLGFPRDRRLTCGGWQCACRLIDARGKVYRSRFADDAPIIRAIAQLGAEEFTRRYHVHVHEEVEAAP